MKKFLAIVAIAVYSFVLLALGGIGIFKNREAIAQLLMDTALTLRVNTIGTVTTPQPLVRADCTPGDQYYACATYTTSNAAKIGTMRFDVNGIPWYFRAYAGPV